MISGKTVSAGYKMSQNGCYKTEILLALSAAAGQLPQGHLVVLLVMVLSKQLFPYLNH